MDLEKIDINEIAQLVDMGMVCYIHKRTHELVHFPDPDQFYDDHEYHFGEDVKKVEDNYKDYIKIKKMNSRLSFKIMEDYTRTISDKKLQSRLFHALERRKPFRNWKYIIDGTGQEREDWFAFKQARMEIWVTCHLDPQDKYGPETLYDIKTTEPELTVLAPHTIAYQVGDLEQALNWYGTVFSAKPKVRTEEFIAFDINGFELRLILTKETSKISDKSPMLYWAVEDIESVLESIIWIGVEYNENITRGKDGKEQVSIIDPWGNIIGLISDPNFNPDL